MAAGGDDQIDGAHDHEWQPGDQGHHCHDQDGDGEAMVTTLGFLTKIARQPFHSAQQGRIRYGDDH